MVVLDEYKNAEVIEVLNTGIKVLRNSFFWKKKKKTHLKTKSSNLRNYLVLCGVTSSLSH